MTEIFIPNNALRSGVRACIENGNRLLIDATILYSLEKYLSAHTLAIFAVEEFGKAILLSKYLHESKGITKNDYEKQILKHPVKIASILMNTIDNLPDEKSRQETREWFRQIGQAEHARKLKTIYVDWNIKERKWSIPTRLLKDDSWAQANEAIRVAGISQYFAVHSLKDANWCKHSGNDK